MAAVPFGATSACIANAASFRSISLQRSLVCIKPEAPTHGFTLERGTQTRTVYGSCTVTRVASSLKTISKHNVGRPAPPGNECIRKFGNRGTPRREHDVWTRHEQWAVVAAFIRLIQNWLSTLPAHCLVNRFSHHKDTILAEQAPHITENKHKPNHSLVLHHQHFWLACLCGEPHGRPRHPSIVRLLKYEDRGHRQGQGKNTPKTERKQDGRETRSVGLGVTIKKTNFPATSASRGQTAESWASVDQNKTARSFKTARCGVISCDLRRRQNK